MSTNENQAARNVHIAVAAGRRIALVVVALCAVLVAGPRQTVAASLVPFSATITETYVINAGACQSAAPVTVCTTGTGQATHLGEIRETAVIETSSTPDSCGVAEQRTTTLTAADGAQLGLGATGQNCLAQGTASDAYVVTGGTGRYRGATGRGTIAVTFPAPGVAVVAITGVLSSPGSLP